LANIPVIVRNALINMTDEKNATDSPIMAACVHRLRF